MTLLAGRILTPHGWQDGHLRFSDVVLEVEPGNAPDRYVLPGFVDVHVHGGGGGDTMDGAQGVRTLAQFHAQHGTTTILPTTITNSWEAVMHALRGVASVLQAGGVPGGADVPGAHLEGPFIHPDRLGAQPRATLNPTPERVKELLDLHVVRIVTLAPDVPGALDAARAFLQAGVRVTLGHTPASYEVTRAFLCALSLERGTVPVAGTHLFNAMTGLSSREPGVVGALLTQGDAYAEVILDLHHVHPAAFQVARASLQERLMLVTDAMRATGLEHGESELGGQTVTVRDGQARLPDGNLAGSVLTMDQAVRNAVTCGVPLEDAAGHASAIPARYLGLDDRGVFHPGTRADVVILDAKLHVQEVWVKGERIR